MQFFKIKIYTWVILYVLRLVVDWLVKQQCLQCLKKWKKQRPNIQDQNATKTNLTHDTSIM